jgi:hypothetical protein
VSIKRLKRPRDPVSLAKLVGDIATGQTEDAVEDKRDPAAVELGRKGGLKGGKARAARLSGKQRTEAAKVAVRARWAKQSSTEQSPASASAVRSKASGPKRRAKLSIPED